MKRLFFSIVMLFAVILFSSCGGIETENINYTKHNNYSSSLKTTEKLINPSTITSNLETTVSTATSKNTINKTTIAKNNKSINITTNQNKNRSVNSNSHGNTKNSNSTTKGIKTDETTINNTEKSDQSIKSETTTQTTTMPPLLDTDFCYITENGKKFHRDNCRYLYKSSIKIIVKQAKDENYSPCLVCKPQ